MWTERRSKWSQEDFMNWEILEKAVGPFILRKNGLIWYPVSDTRKLPFKERNVSLYWPSYYFDTSRFFQIRKNQCNFVNWKVGSIWKKKKVKQQQLIPRSISTPDMGTARADRVLLSSQHLPTELWNKTFWSLGLCFQLVKKLHLRKRWGLIYYHYQLWLANAFLISVSSFLFLLISNVKQVISIRKQIRESLNFFFVPWNEYYTCKCTCTAVNSWKHNHVLPK